MSRQKRRAQINRFIFSAAVITALFPFAALAQEGDVQDAEVQDAPVTEKCFPAKGMVKHVKKMNTLKPMRMDTLHAVMSAALERVDGSEDPLPPMWSRDKGVDTPFILDAEGRFEGFNARLLTLSKDAEICGAKSADDDEDNPSFKLEMESDVMFKNSTGPYTLAELQDGVADGKSFYKKMMPGPVALLVPKMTHIMVDYLAEDTPLEISFSQGGQVVAKPPIEVFGGTYVISLEDIEASGADMMTLGGGAYNLMPTPSIKKMRSLGFTEDEPEEEASEQ